MNKIITVVLLCVAVTGCAGSGIDNMRKYGTVLPPVGDGSRSVQTQVQPRSTPNIDEMLTKMKSDMRDIAEQSQRRQAEIDRAIEEGKAKPTHTTKYGALAKNYQRQIKTYMNHFLKDPYSAHYEFLSGAGTHGGYVQTKKPAEVKGGQVVYVVINAKNSYGGYAGRTTYVCFFEGGRELSICTNDITYIVEVK